jgi:hypothetical protein
LLTISTWAGACSLPKISNTLSALAYVQSYRQLILKFMYEIKMKFWCNAGHTEEEVSVPIYENSGTEDEQIQDYFERWLDNNEDVGYERLP